jgi:agmatine deiminase
MKEIVYIANSLKRYSLVYHPLITSLKDNGIKVEILDSANIWVRDYLPIQTKNGFIKFKYKTLGYDEWPQLKIDPDSDYWLAIFGKFKNLTYTDIILDGGNCQMNPARDVAVITDIVLKNNPEYEKEDLINKLSELLDVRVIIIPREPGDELGHADGIVKFIDEHSILLNDYSGHYISYRNKVTKILKSNGLRIFDFPNYYHLRPKITEKEFRVKYPYGDDFNPGWGYAINYLKVARLIFAPIFNIKEDNITISMIEKCYPDCNIVAVDCSDLSMEGGLLNCVTREYKL